MVTSKGPPPLTPPTRGGEVEKGALLVTAQVFRLKAEVYKTSRKARLKPFKTFSVSTTFGSIRDESSLGKKPKRFTHGLSLKALSLQSSAYLPE